MDSLVNKSITKITNSDEYKDRLDREEESTNKLVNMSVKNIQMEA